MHRAAAWCRRLLRHVGRKGAFLLLLAAIDMVIGYSLHAPLPFGLSREQVYHTFIQVMPLELWAEAWWNVGAVCAVCAAVQRLRPLAFGLATLLKMAWGLLYLIGWLNHDPGTFRGYLSATLWLGLAGFTVLVSGWRENPWTAR